MGLFVPETDADKTEGAHRGGLRPWKQAWLEPGSLGGVLGPLRVRGPPSSPVIIHCDLAYRSRHLTPRGGWPFRLAVLLQSNGSGLPLLRSAPSQLLVALQAAGLTVPCTNEGPCSPASQVLRGWSIAWSQRPVFRCLGFFHQNIHHHPFHRGLLCCTLSTSTVYPCLYYTFVDAVAPPDLGFPGCLCTIASCPCPCTRSRCSRSTMGLILIHLLAIGTLLNAWLVSPAQVGDNTNKLDWQTWGPYRPNLYFGVRPQIPETLLMGLIWASGDDRNRLVDSMSPTQQTTLSSEYAVLTSHVAQHYGTLASRMTG